MAQRIYDIINRYTGLVATGLVLLLFIAVNVAATPLLNSGDDAFLMYTLAGGFGEPPTELLHYNYGWHFFLSTLVKSAYSLSPSLNWYAIFLMGIHLTGCATLFFVLLKRMPVYLAGLLFFVLFFFIEIRLLLSLTFTGTAMVAATAGICLLTHQLQTGKTRYRRLVWGFLLLLLAGLLRMHAVWLAIALMLPLAITVFKRKQALQWVISMFLSVLLLWGLNGLHQQYYKKRIPGWEQQEKFRQALFKAYNRPVKSQSEIQALGDTNTLQLFFAAFLYDSSTFNADKITVISSKVTRQRNLFNKTDREGLYWFFIETRVYILLFAVLLLPLFLQRKHKPVLRWLLSLATYIAAHGFLFIYMKLTPPLHLGMLMILLISLLLQLSPADTGFANSKKVALIYSLVLILLFGWMGLRVTRENEANRNKHQRFLCAVKSIAGHPDKLFVATYDIFPLDYFYIWDTPSRFPVTNLLYKDRLLTHTYPFALQRFGITDINTALHNHPGVYLLGPPLPALLNKEQHEIFTGPLPGFGCLEVRQIVRTK